jgi:hypothetical protein
MHLRSFRSWIALVCLTLLITACGGGGGGNSDSGNSSTGAAATNSIAGSGTTSAPSGAATPTPTAITYPVQLKWTAPSTRADGSALAASELTGYRIYYSLDGTPADQDTVVPISSGATTAFTINLTAAGTYVFAITAIDQNGLESALSSPVLIAVN